nr:bifunctional 3-(3-hydroxy-phenyl)propionate/3-hydroxycinnamic acid hydroxylase [Rhizobium sp. SJZ105]
MESYDVVQIGFGPVGQVSAAALGQRGHKVGVFERFGSLYALPRAGHVDHEIMRAFQSIGAVEKMLDDAFRCSKYGWRNQHGHTLLDIDWSYDGISGWASDYLIYQPYVEDALNQAVRRHPSVDVHHGWTAVGIEPGDKWVEVELAQGVLEGTTYRLTGERRRVRGRYLIGADGANSIVRSLSDIPMVDKGFNEQWLVTDFRQKMPLHFEFDNGQICDPARPMCLFQLGRTHRRFEFMVMPDDDVSDITSRESVWRLVAPWITPEQAELIRATVYTFRSANAARWRSGRSLLIGDAAHLMPPFLGQGMCSGVRDAVELAWKLDLVLTGKVSDQLLDTHMIERKPHVDAITDQAVALGKVSCTIDPAAAALRDQAFLSGNVPPPPPFPILEEGILDDGQGPANARVRGRLGPQGVIKVGDRESLADNVIGPGWQLISRDDVTATAQTRTKTILNELDVKLLNLDSKRLLDTNGTYKAYLEEIGARAILVRPDFYVYGAVEADETLDRLIGELSVKLGLRELALQE